MEGVDEVMCTSMQGTCWAPINTIINNLGGKNVFLVETVYVMWCKVLPYLARGWAFLGSRLGEQISQFLSMSIEL